MLLNELSFEGRMPIATTEIKPDTEILTEQKHGIILC
jgi:hypothetical protein